MLVSDFRSAYDAVAQHHEKCWPHLLRELKEIENTDDSPEWKGFAKKLRRIYADGIRLKLAQDALGEETFARRLDLLQKRLIDLAIAEHSHAHAQVGQASGEVQRRAAAVCETQGRAVGQQPGGSGDPPGGADAEGELRQRQWPGPRPAVSS